MTESIDLKKSMAKDYEKHILWIGTSILLIAALIYVAISSDGPFIPFYIVVWGFIGAATYVVKTVAGLIGEDTFDDNYIPYHISRLAIGPSLAVIVYFLVISGSFLGITFKTEAAHIEYAYSALAFLSGYFVRQVVDSLSIIMESIFTQKEKNVK